MTPLPPFGLWLRVARDAHLLLAAAAALDAPAAQRVSQIGRLRKHHDAATVAVALDLVRARRKAAVKFAEAGGGALGATFDANNEPSVDPAAAGLILDPAGVEQATSTGVARHKAHRFAHHTHGPVVDLGCGVGGDTRALAGTGRPVLAVDLDPTRAAMAARFAGVRAAVADAARWAAPAGVPPALHLDPARRTAAGRTSRLADTAPPPAVVERLIREHAAAGVAVKLSPAVRRDELAALLRPPGADRELEFISEGGRLVQAVLWTGPLAPHGGVNRATRLHGGRTHTLAGPASDAAAGPGVQAGLGFAEPSRYLFTVDPAVERAGLLGELGLPAVHPRLGVLTADDPAAPARAAPWVTAFERLDTLPWRPAKVRRALAALGAGVVDVKTRGGAVDPDAAARDLRGEGDRPLVVFVLRFDQRVLAFITRRMPCVPR